MLRRRLVHAHRVFLERGGEVVLSPCVTVMTPLGTPRVCFKINMNTIELFAGTRSFSKVAKELGHCTFTTDYEEIDGQDLIADVRELTARDFPYQTDILWASPPCEGFSVASIGHNWTGGYEGTYQNQIVRDVLSNSHKMQYASYKK